MLRSFKLVDIARKTANCTVTLRPIRALSASTVSSGTNAQVASPARNSSLLTRNLCSTTSRRKHVASESTLPPWIELLELTAQAPWLSSVPEDYQDRLRRSYTFLLQIVMYLTGPTAQGTVKDEAAAQQFLLAFNFAPVAADSEIGRARYAIGILTKTVTNDISTIPALASVRTQHARVFGLSDALVPLCDGHLEGLTPGTAAMSGEIVSEGRWQDFWSKAHPVVVSLTEELDKEGYGIDDDLIKEAKAEQERKERDTASRKRVK